MTRNEERKTREGRLEVSPAIKGFVPAAGSLGVEITAAAGDRSIKAKKKEKRKKETYKKKKGKKR